MNTSLSPGTAEARAEADWLCALVASHAPALKAAAFQREFQLAQASFRLHAKDRNTLYRVSGQFQWFLKMTPAGDEQVGRERLGASVIGDVLSTRPEYVGAPVVRVGTDPSYVLASSVPGRPMSRALVTNTWIPHRGAVVPLETAFGNLGLVLGTLHAHARIDPTAPRATKRPFAALRSAAEKQRVPETLKHAIAECLGRHRGDERPSGFVHGNLRLDNVMVFDGRIGLIDLEHSGIGSFYQDLSRPIAQLILTRAAITFPHRRVAAYLRSFMRRYGQAHAYDSRVLNDYVFARLAKYCIDSRRRTVPLRIGGIPILSSRLERLSLAVLNGGIAEAVPESRCADGGGD